MKKNVIFAVILAFLTVGGILAAAPFLVEQKLMEIHITSAQSIPITGPALKQVVSEIIVNVVNLSYIICAVSFLFNLIIYIRILSNTDAKKTDIAIHLVINFIIAAASFVAQMVLALRINGNQILENYGYSKLSVADTVFAGVIFCAAVLILGVITLWERILRGIKSKPKSPSNLSPSGKENKKRKDI